MINLHVDSQRLQSWLSVSAEIKMEIFEDERVFIKKKY